MNYIENLLQGQKVEWKTLGEVCELQRGKSITSKDLKDGNIPVIAGGQKPAYFHNEHNREGETIVVAGSGAYAGFVSYWNEPIFVSDAFSIKPNNEELFCKYVFHFLKDKQESLYGMKKGGGVPHVYAKDVAKIKIPLPPLAVQKEIANILDKFNELEKELEKELELRKKQYEYYRNNLLSFNEIGGGNWLKTNNLQWKTLGEVCGFRNGFAFQSKKFQDEGEPILRIGNIQNQSIQLDDLKYFNKKDYKQNLKPFEIKNGDILIAMSGATTGKVGILKSEKTFYLNQRVGKFEPFEGVLHSRYLYHYLLSKTNDLYILAGGGAQPNLSSTMIMEKIKIPLPPLEEQKRIVNILDKFDTLTNSITEGLPKEIELRRKQYEYYREKLLSFNKD